MQDKQKKKLAKRIRRHRRVRSNISGTKSVPRLSVYRSLRHIYAQLIDDQAGKTLVASADLLVRDVKPEGNMTTKVAVAYAVGKDLAEKAKGAGVTKVVFDRGGNKYHGRIKALADGAREGGLEF